MHTLKQHMSVVQILILLCHMYEIVTVRFGLNLTNLLFSNHDMLLMIHYGHS